MQTTAEILDRKLETVDDYIQTQRDWIDDLDPERLDGWSKGFSSAIEELAKFIEMTDIGPLNVQLVCLASINQVLDESTAETNPEQR